MEVFAPYPVDIRPTFDAWSPEEKIAGHVPIRQHRRDAPQIANNRDRPGQKLASLAAAYTRAPGMVAATMPSKEFRAFDSIGQQ